MASLEEELRRLKEQLVQRQLREAGLLRQGLSYAEIAQALEDFPLRLPEDLLRLYKWCDGMEPRGSAASEFVPGYSLFSLEEAMEHYQGLRAVAVQIASDHDCDPTSTWHPRWFPIMADFAKGYFVVLGEIESGDLKDPRVYSVYLVDAELIWEYDSLASMVATIAACYETEAFYMRDDGLMATVPLEVTRIFRELNPQRTATALEEAKTDSIEGLVQSWKHKNWDIRTKAKIALLQLADEKACTALIACLDNDDPERREEVAEMLGQLKVSAAVDGLLPLLQDPDLSVRVTAAGSLGDIESPQAVDALIQALNTDSPKLQRIAAWSLGKISHRSVIAPLMRALHDESHHVREAAREALAVIRDRSTKKGKKR